MEYCSNEKNDKGMSVFPERVGSSPTPILEVRDTRESLELIKQQQIDMENISNCIKEALTGPIPESCEEKCEAYHDGIVFELERVVGRNGKIMDLLYYISSRL